MAVELGAQAGSGYPTFEEYFIQLLRNTTIEDVEVADGTGGLRMSLNAGYSGDRVLDAYRRDWEVKTWTPLLLARAIVDFKRRLGGDARVTAVGHDFIELAQTRCEFGEPKEGRYRGSMCEVCKSAIVAMARASRMVDERQPATNRCTIAQGCRACDLTIPLST